MAFRIGFAAEKNAEKQDEVTHTARKEQAEVRRSVVQVEFPGRGMPLAYYNDRFDLKPGDKVYVDGQARGASWQGHGGEL